MKIVVSANSFFVMTGYWEANDIIENISMLYNVTIIVSLIIVTS